jgi:hypothetical protein
VDVEEEAFVVDAEQVGAVSPRSSAPSVGGEGGGGGGGERERESPDSGHVTDLHSVVRKFVAERERERERECVCRVGVRKFVCVCF